jgi:S1-C subfamily serine protease
MKTALLAAIAALMLAGDIMAGVNTDINTILMRSTFKVAGEGSLGTAFIVGRPSKTNPQQLYYVLVTADHVLREMKGESAVLFLRKATPEGFVRLPFPLKIRNGEQELWTRHPKADVAVMYLRLPSEADVQLVSSDLLATDIEIAKYEIHPGDVLSCLGYPYGAEANEAGFPILRSGQIASYPLTPTAKYPTFLFDFRVFGGNSGGPVFFAQSNRTYGGQTMLGETIQLLFGVVIEEQMLQEEVRSLTEVRTTSHPLSLAVVVTAPVVRARDRVVN